MQHLYIHIPFCHRRCSYCDFNTYANMEDRIQTYVDALCTELQLRAAGLLPFASTPAQLRPLAPGLTRADLVPTIFFGGGTPSMLSVAQMAQVLDAADGIVPRQRAEVTIEANPGTVLGRDYLRDLRGLGVNRISMGVQSLSNPALRVLGRIHTAEEAYHSFDDARAAGFERINLDFMFGLPGQTVAEWDATLREIVTWNADHFSLYSLILEESTPLYAQVTAGRVSVPDDDVTGEMYEQAMAQFAAAGYTHYEISNWARDAAPAADELTIPAQACHHNLAYWLNADYLAAGAGAHGHTFPTRYHDLLKIDDYIATADAGELPTAETVPLEPRDLYAETMFMGLRLNVGVGYAHFRDRCGIEMRDVYGQDLADLERDGLLVSDETGVRLTERGRMIGNRVFERFV